MKMMTLPDFAVTISAKQYEDLRSGRTRDIECSAQDAWQLKEYQGGLLVTTNERGEEWAEAIAERLWVEADETPCQIRIGRIWPIEVKPAKGGKGIWTPEWCCWCGAIIAENVAKGPACFACGRRAWLCGSGPAPMLAIEGGTEARSC